MLPIDQLIARVQHVQQGFTEIRKTADEVVSSATPADCFTLAQRRYESPVHQARMLATFICGHLAAENPESLAFLHDVVSQDTDWRVQEILAQAFDMVCRDIGYEQALPIIREWLTGEHPHLRRAASEGLRIWTARPYFRDNPQVAIQLLSQLRDDASEYVRKSAGNALRDISRKHPDLVRAEVQQWDTSSKQVAQTYKLASKFL